MTLGELLRSSRMQKSMSLRETADLVGMTASHLCSLEHDNHEPSIRLCARLAVVLGLTVSKMAAAALNTPVRKKRR